LRIEHAETTHAADVVLALLKAYEPAVRGAALYRQVGAPRIVLGVGARADSRDTGEKRGHEEKSLHGLLLGLPLTMDSLL
jgi:hypothetical protein